MLARNNGGGAHLLKKREPTVANIITRRISVTTRAQMAGCA
jgi:hypothetical protein